MKPNARRIVLWILGIALTAVFVVYMIAEVIRPAALQTPVPQGGPLAVRDVLFYAIAALTIAGACGVAVSRNILYSALSLLMALLGAGSLYVFLSADFVAVTQLLIYIGGVLVLVLFAVFLTSRIAEVKISNASFGLLGGVLLFAAAAPVLLAVAALAPWPVPAGNPPALASTTQAIGDAFLTRWLLPFEVASLVLLATLIGAVVIARKEIKAD